MWVTAVTNTSFRTVNSNAFSSIAYLPILQTEIYDKYISLIFVNIWTDSFIVINEIDMLVFSP